VVELIPCETEPEHQASHEVSKTQTLVLEAKLCVQIGHCQLPLKMMPLCNLLVFLVEDNPIAFPGEILAFTEAVELSAAKSNSKLCLAQNVKTGERATFLSELNRTMLANKFL
jgi:hypothetical protein